jgi:hypothetical protein
MKSTRMAAEKSPIEQPEHPEVTRGGVGVLASWLIAIVFGAAFWIVVVPAILRVIERR